MVLTRPQETRERYGCGSRARCSNTNQAWRTGCRHPEAVAAHAAWLAERRADREAALSADGVCRARAHGTCRSYRTHGCRCPEAVAAYRTWENTRRDADQRRRDLGAAMEFAEHQRKVKVLTGGRLDRDPRRPFRHGAAAVTRTVVRDLVDGLTGGATTAERMVAVLRLATRRVWDQGGWKIAGHYRPMLDSEIGHRIGVIERQIPRLRARPDALRRNRTARRLADAQWRAAIHAAAADDPGRKERERRRHELAAGERDLRQRLYAVRKARREQGQPQQ